MIKAFREGPQPPAFHLAIGLHTLEQSRKMHLVFAIMLSHFSLLVRGCFLEARCLRPLSNLFGKSLRCSEETFSTAS